MWDKFASFKKKMFYSLWSTDQCFYKTKWSFFCVCLRAGYADYTLLKSAVVITNQTFHASVLLLYTVLLVLCAKSFFTCPFWGISWVSLVHQFVLAPLQNYIGIFIFFHYGFLLLFFRWSSQSLALTAGAVSLSCCKCWHHFCTLTTHACTSLLVYRKVLNDCSMCFCDSYVCAPSWANISFDTFRFCILCHCRFLWWWDIAFTGELRMNDEAG